VFYVVFLISLAQKWFYYIQPAGTIGYQSGVKEVTAEINHSLYDISHSSNKVVILADLRQGFLLELNVRNCEKLSLKVFG
jgi:hypothetical protein